MAGSGDSLVDNIAGYVYDHTTCHEPHWQSLEPNGQGPFFVSAKHPPGKDQFLEFIERHRDKNSWCDSLDGQVHSLDEIARWIGIGNLPVRFLGLGVILDVFKLLQPWEGRERRSGEEMSRHLEGEDEGLFKLKVSRPWGRRSGHQESLLPR